MGAPRRLLARIAGLLVIGIGLLSAVPGPVRASDYVDGFEDLPLMPGLANVPAASVSFDAAMGRIVVAFAEGRVGMPAVRAVCVQKIGAVACREGRVRDG